MISPILIEMLLLIVNLIIHRDYMCYNNLLLYINKQITLFILNSNTFISIFIIWLDIKLGLLNIH